MQKYILLAMDYTNMSRMIYYDSFAFHETNFFSCSIDWSNQLSKSIVITHNALNNSIVHFHEIKVKITQAYITEQDVISANVIFSCFFFARPFFFFAFCSGL